MAAALSRRGTGLCCIQRELCRVVWRPQTAQFSSKPPDRKPPPRRTHIKKAKPQPAVDVAKLLEQLFPQRRPGTAPPVARPTKPPAAASSVNVSASNVPPLSKNEPAASVPPAVSSFARSLSSVAVPTISGSTPASLAGRTSMKTIETSVEAATEPVELKTAARQPLSDHETDVTSSFPAASVEPLVEIVERILSHPVEPSVEAPAEEAQTKTTDVSYSAKVEPLIEPTVESPVETDHFTMRTVETSAAVVKGPVEPPVDVTAREVQTESTDSGGVDVLRTMTVEPLIETTVEPVSEKSRPLVETLENRSAVAEGSVEATIDADAAALSVQTNSTLSHAAEEEPLIETTIEPAVEASHSTLGTIETRSTPVEVTIEPPIDVTVDLAAQELETKSTDSGPVHLSHAAEEEPLIETTIEPPVEASHSTLGTIETRATAVEGPVEPPIDVTVDRAAQIDSGPVQLSHAAEEEPLIETTIEPPVEASLVCEGTIEPVIETDSGGNLSPAALIQKAEESAPLTLKNEPRVESTVDSVDAAVEEEGNRSEEMTLESVTLHVDRVLVASFQTDELQRTISYLEERADEQVQELSVQTEIGVESSGEDEREILTEVLSKWDSLSEDLREFEGESGALAEELLCQAPPAETPRSVRTSPAAEAEAVTTECMTLAEVEGLEVEDPPESRSALEEADAPAKETKVEVATAMDEETAEAELLTLEAVSLESVTLAEVQASLGTLEEESMSETTNLLEEAAEIVAGEQKTAEETPEETPRETPKETPEETPKETPEETPEETPSLLAEDLQMEASDAAVAVGSVDVDAAPEVTDDLKEVLLEEEEEEEEEAQAEASGNEDGQETHADLDPVQRLFLEKIKEYNNTRRLNGGLLEAEPDHEKYLSEETAKLRRLYGGGDLSSFPRFTFTEPQLDQDS